MFHLELVSGLRKSILVALQNGADISLRDTGVLQRRLYPLRLHPHHPSAAESRGGDNGKFYGTGHVR